MATFSHPDQAEQIEAKIQKLADADLTPLWAQLFDNCSDPDRALINLDRWLSATSNPGTVIGHLASVPELAKLLVQLLGASQAVSDALIQNPELASMVTDPVELSRPISAAAVLEEGKQLLSHAGSYAHKLDRLRYLKQRWRLPLMVNDLAGAWTPQQVWRAISDLADAIIELALDAAWQEYSSQKGLSKPCPVMIVGFGKLGGHELNYSSDVDLVYVVEDAVDESLERHVGRFCEMLSNALSTPMGRGSLYRVDLRLRPFGSAGPIAPTMGAVEAYYRSHAELWEFQALIRSRPIAGELSLWPRWEALLTQYCYRKSTSELAVESILETRDRIEGLAPDSDFKRGHGGIRDVEFLVQVLQMLHGYEHAELRVRPTLEAARMLSTLGYLDPQSLAVLEEGYTFLRQLEHRCQLVDDQQTHSVPRTDEGRAHVARMMGYLHWEELEAQLDEHRRTVRDTYTREFQQLVGASSHRGMLLQRLKEPLQSEVRDWFDKMPGRDEFYRCLLDNSQSLSRVSRVAEDAPALLPGIAESLAVTEEIVSGEIEEELSVALPAPDPEDPARYCAAALQHWRQIVVRWVLEPEDELGPKLCQLYDAVLKGVLSTLGSKFDVVALGSYGSLDIGLNSDLDVLLLVGNHEDHTSAEHQAQRLLAFMSEMKRFGWPAAVDLRLRPEGRQGLLVRTHSGLKNYELERMEMWERFALGNARLVAGKESSLEIALRVAYALPLTPERLKELAAMKHRIETERVAPQHWKRDVKLGFGGLSDIDWFVHLYEMRYQTALGVGGQLSMRDRLRRMAQAGLINALEYEMLLQARLHLLETRNRLVLLGFSPDVVPENPDKLERLARASRMANGYQFQQKHEQIIQSVRTIYEEGLERLGV